MIKLITGIIGGVALTKIFGKMEKPLLKQFLDNPDDFEITEYVDRSEEEIVIKIRKKACE